MPDELKETGKFFKTVRAIFRELSRLVLEVDQETDTVQEALDLLTDLRIISRRMNQDIGRLDNVLHVLTYGANLEQSLLDSHLTLARSIRYHLESLQIEPDVQRPRLLSRNDHIKREGRAHNPALRLAKSS